MIFMATDKNRKILVVDDVELNRAILYELFCNEYEVIEAENGKEALDVLSEHANEISMVLLDIVMPVMDGLAVLKEMRRIGYLSYIPVVMVTAESTEGISLQMYELGASDVITKPFNVAVVRQRVDNIVELYDYRRDLEDIVKSQTLKLEEQSEKLKQTNVFVIDTLCTAVEFRNGESGTHVVRIRDITRLLLKEFGKRVKEYQMDDEKIEVISNASAMHDIGKISVPDAILMKPGRLTKEEFEIMKMHTIKGCELLSKLDYVQDQEYYQYCYEICRYHHERWDGGGYPDKLVGNEIPIWAQVVSIADVYDALVSERSYKKAFTHDEALKMIANGECGAFEPQMLKCFLEIGDKLRELYAHIKETDDEPVEPLVLNTNKNFSNIQRMQKLLEIEQTKYHMMSETSTDIVFEYDVEDDSITLSDNAVTILDTEPIIPDILKKKAKPKVLFEDDYIILHQIFDEINEHQSKISRRTLRINTRRGQCEWYEVVARGFYEDDNGAPKLTNIVGKIVNINELKQEAVRWELETQLDPLTKLVNRKTFQKMASGQLMHTPVMHAAMLFVDVDNLKHINEAYGYSTGDKVLVAVADMLRECFRNTDVIARGGSDEFVVFMPGAADRQMLEKKMQLLEQMIVESPLQNDLRGYSFTISAGIACYPEDATDYPSLVHHADEALYATKAKGNSGHLFYDEIEKE